MRREANVRNGHGGYHTFQEWLRRRRRRFCSIVWNCSMLWSMAVCWSGARREVSFHSRVITSVAMAFVKLGLRSI